MKLVIGLGNPGKRYRDNRHNVGHMVVDALLKRKLPKDFVIKKTDVFMNESGNFVKKLVEQYKVNTSDLWIIHDDLDIKLGYYKIQFGKGPKVHNGILSVEKELGSSELWRVRIGIDNRQAEPFDFARGKEYVLQNFTDEEKAVLDKVIDEICKKLATS